MALDLKDNNINDIIKTLIKEGFLITKIKNEWTTIPSTKEGEAQVFIDNMNIKLPNLTPRQFRYLLARNGLDTVMNTVLEQLRETNLEVYAHCKSQLDGASYFEWEKAKALYAQLKPMIVALNPELDFTVEDLKLKWLLCYES